MIGNNYTIFILKLVIPIRSILIKTGYLDILWIFQTIILQSPSSFLGIIVSKSLFTPKNLVYFSGYEFLKALLIEKMMKKILPLALY